MWRWTSQKWFRNLFNVSLLCYLCAEITSSLIPNLLLLLLQSATGAATPAEVRCEPTACSAWRATCCMTGCARRAAPLGLIRTGTYVSVSPTPTRQILVPPSADLQFCSHSLLLIKAVHQLQSSQRDRFIKEWTVMMMFKLFLWGEEETHLNRNKRFKTKFISGRSGHRRRATTGRRTLKRRARVHLENKKHQSSCVSCSSWISAPWKLNEKGSKNQQKLLIRS